MRMALASLAALGVAAAAGGPALCATTQSGSGLAPVQVQDLHYGDILFYVFQDDYFEAIVRDPLRVSQLALDALDLLGSAGETGLEVGDLLLHREHFDAAHVKFGLDGFEVIRVEDEIDQKNIIVNSEMNKKNNNLSYILLFVMVKVSHNY